MRWLACMFLLSGFSAQAAMVTELIYHDQDPGSEAYVTRILVNERYMRLDDGRDGGDFVLFDRKKGEVVNVLHGLKVLMRVTGRPLPLVRPAAYRVEERAEQVKQGTMRLQIRADGVLCSETVSARDLLPDAARAMSEYKLALAYTQLQTYLNTPEDLRQPCDLLHHVWESGRSLAYGLPLEERDYSGRLRRFSGSTRKPLDSSWFTLPEGYQTLQPPEADQATSNWQPADVQTR
ncbi:MAG: hypothetical protein HXY27_02905 [Hydrogenophilaceae bacterium]|nr:hypothetical protein [Hydrogenophilaceae bacterium]